MNHFFLLLLFLVNNCVKSKIRWVSPPHLAIAAIIKNVSLVYSNPTPLFKSSQRPFVKAFFEVLAVVCESMLDCKWDYATGQRSKSSGEHARGECWPSGRGEARRGYHARTLHLGNSNATPRPRLLSHSNNKPWTCTPSRSNHEQHHSALLLLQLLVLLRPWTCSTPELPLMMNLFNPQFWTCSFRN